MKICKNLSNDIHEMKSPINKSAHLSQSNDRKTARTFPRMSWALQVNEKADSKRANNKLINQYAGGVIMGDSKTATIISESEWAWDRPGEEPRGLGDYRVPKDMLSDLDGYPRTRASLAPKLGNSIL